MDSSGLLPLKALRSMATQACSSGVSSRSSLRVPDLRISMAGKILHIISRVILLIFAFMMFRYGLALVAKQMETGQLSPVMKVPMYILYLSLPIYLESPASRRFSC
jgi:TRAP-type C4-dicarboxylate transport system permease small subunit